MALATSARVRGWTGWQPMLDADVDLDALREAIHDAEANKPGWHGRPDAAPGTRRIRFPLRIDESSDHAIRVHIPRRRMTPPRMLHFDLKAQPLRAWGCHRNRWIDILLAGRVVPFFFGAAFLWWAFPRDEAVAVVEAAGGRVLAAAEAPRR